MKDIVFKLGTPFANAFVRFARAYIDQKNPRRMFTMAHGRIDGKMLYVQGADNYRAFELALPLLSASVEHGEFLLSPPAGRITPAGAGKTKNVQNYISATYPDGHSEVLFTPLSPFETPGALDRICDEYNRVIGNSEVEPIIMIPIFIHDFLYQFNSFFYANLRTKV